MTTQWEGQRERHLQEDSETECLGGKVKSGRKHKIRNAVFFNHRVFVDTVEAALLKPKNKHDVLEMRMMNALQVKVASLRGRCEFEAFLIHEKNISCRKTIVLTLGAVSTRMLILSTQYA